MEANEGVKEPLLKESADSVDILVGTLALTESERSSMRQLVVLAPGEPVPLYPYIRNVIGVEDEMARPVWVFNAHGVPATTIVPVTISEV